MTSCSYISGSFCLTANIMFDPYHPQVKQDVSLINLSISLLEDLIQQSGNDNLRNIHSACKELLSYATILSPKIQD